MVLLDFRSAAWLRWTAGARALDLIIEVLPEFEARIVGMLEVLRDFSVQTVRTRSILSLHAESLNRYCGND